MSAHILSYANVCRGQSTQPQSNAPSSAQIDIAHLRPTTKFDQLTPDLQRDIEALDGLILNQIRHHSELTELLPAVTSAGTNISPAIDYVSQKLDELETGLENDAEAVVTLRDGDVKEREAEGKCVFRAVDRLKVPRQYQVGHTDSMQGSVYGGAGLSGWWNNPQTLRGTMRASTAGQTMQLPEDELDEGKGPKSLIELFSSRTDEMAGMMTENRQLLGEIEGFVGGLEDKVRGKERELNERLNYGESGGVENEREHQMQLLRYVFGEVQRSLYDVADKVAGCRDGVAEVGMGR